MNYNNTGDCEEHKCLQDGKQQFLKATICLIYLFSSKINRPIS